MTASPHPSAAPPAVEAVPGEDAYLLAELASGDRQAFENLYDRHIRAVHAYSRTHVAEREDAEEITQDVFVTLWNRRRAVTIVGSSLLPWLLVTCKNKIANQRRAALVHSRRLSNSEIDDTTPSIAPGPEDVAQSTELRDVIESAVASLTDRDQALFQYCIVDGRTYEDAAALLGVSPGVVRNRLSRLRSTLRNELRTLRGNS